MKRVYYLLLISIISLSTNAQSLTISLHPAKKYPWLVMYKLENVQQEYVTNKQLDSLKHFSFDMHNQKPGIYLLMYDTNPNHFIYFVYNQKDIVLKAYPKQNNKIEIIASTENKIYLPYAGKHDLLIYKLNQIENKLAKNDSLTKTEIEKFAQLKTELDSLQQTYLKKSKGHLVHTYVQNMHEYYPDIYLPKDTYFKDKMAHYFDGFDFNNSELSYTNIIIHKINHYVFDIHPPTNPKTEDKEYLKRIENVLPKIKNNLYRNNVIFSLTTSFVNVDGRVSKMLIHKYINKMPEDEKAKINIKNILNEIGLTIGDQAPDFSFKDINNTYTLSEIAAKKPYTLLVFWSATCSHCLKSMPKLEKLMKDQKDFEIVAIGLESDIRPWNSEHQYYAEFTHGIKLKKWENPIVQTYHLKATPGYFILNNKMEIIALPYELENIEKFLKTLQK